MDKAKGHAGQTSLLNNVQRQVDVVPETASLTVGVPEMKLKVTLQLYESKKAPSFLLRVNTV